MSQADEREAEIREKVVKYLVYEDTFHFAEVKFLLARLDEARADAQAEIVRLSQLIGKRNEELARTRSQAAELHELESSTIEDLDYKLKEEKMRYSRLMDSLETYLGKDEFEMLFGSAGQEALKAGEGSE